MEENNLFDNSIEEIKCGYIETDKFYICSICNEKFEKGRIFKICDELYEAKRAIELHIEKNHISMLDYLLNLNSTYNSISESQKAVIELLAKGYSDKEIASELKIAQSTIRNHRYKLREKEKQAKVFISIMELLESRTNKEIKETSEDKLLDFHKGAKGIDDRFNITEGERDKVLATYFDENKALKSYPSKEKKKIILLQEITKNFSSGKRYKEVEINRILKRIYEDNVAIRRDLIDYGFLERTKDCKEYWVKE